MTTNPDNPLPQEIALSDDDSMAIQQILVKYLKHWKWFIFSLIVFVTIGFGCIYLFTPQYLITASILVKDQKKGTGISMLEELDLFYSAKVVENEIEILRSYTLLEEVIDELNLQVQYYFKSRWQTIQLYGNLPVHIEIVTPTAELFARPFLLYFDGNEIVFDEKRYPRDALITESFGSIRITALGDDSLSLPKEWNMEYPLIVEFTPKSLLLESLHKNLQVSITKNTSVINLFIHSPIPQLGKDILNQLIVSYNNASINDKNNMARITLDFIEERILLVGEDLQKAERDVEQYKTQQGITDISTESSLFLQNIQQKDAELSKVRIQLDVLSQIEQYVLSGDSGSSSAPATLGLSDDPILISLITSLLDAEAERRRLLATVQPGNLRVKAIDDQIMSLKGKVIDNIQSMRRSLETTQRNLLTESRRMGAIIGSMPKKERELIDVTRQQGIVNELFIFLLSKREETAILHAATVADSRIIDPARSTTFPVQPNQRIILMSFVLIGLLVPAGIIWLKDTLNTTIRTKGDLENYLKPSIVGEMSYVGKATNYVIVTKNKSRPAEQLRTLRTNIQYMQAGGGVKVILVTSSISNEGKTFISANIGVSFAVMGKKTIMLSFDLRKAVLHKFFGIENEIGLSNYLAGQVELDQIIRSTEVSENLHIITCGHVAPNPQELLLGDRLPQLFDYLKEKYDYVVIDTPPVGLMSDARIINRYTDVTLYVLRQNYTPKDRIRLINDLYVSHHLKNLGVVVNGVKEDEWDGYNYGSDKYYDQYYSNDE